MDSMLEILNECLQDSNLETVSKAELRQKYLVKAGLTKLPKEDKSLFTSAVNAAFINYISSKAKASDIVENIKSVESPNNEIKETTEAKTLIMDSCSEDDITPANIKEDFIADLCANGSNDMQVEHSSYSDENSLSSYKNVIKKSSNGIKKQRRKRTLTSSSEDETTEIKPVKKSKYLKKARKSSDSETEFIVKSAGRKNVSETKNHFKKTAVDSSDSEEPLTVFQKKSNSFNRSLNSVIKSDKSEKECRLKYVTKQTKDTNYSEDEPVMPSTNSINDSKNHSSDSEDEPLTKYRKCQDSIHSDESSNSFTKKKLISSNKPFKSIESTSGSENETVLTLTKRKSNLLNKSCGSKTPPSESENESLAKYSKKKINISVHSNEEPSVNGSLKLMKTLSDSKDVPLSNSSNKETDNSINSKMKRIISRSKSKEKVLKKRRFVESDDNDGNISIQMQEKSFDGIKNSLSDSSEDEPLSSMKNKKLKSNLLNESCTSKNSSGSEDESPAKYSKKKVINSIDSDEEPVTIVTENSNSVDGSLNVKNLRDSEDEPISNLNNNETNNSSDSKKEPDEKIVKRKAKHHLKKPVISSNKSKEQFLKIKKFADSDDDDSNISNQKQKKNFDEQNNSLSDSSEDEPLNMLSTKKVNKQKSSESGSSSFVDENEEHSSKKNKPSKKKEANDSGKERKRLSASENKIEHLKKYLRVAGIRIPNYNKLFQNCKTMKAKCEKLMSLLEKEGLKGRPTLEKCKKLRKKIETKREIAELDVSNILKMEGGRPKRSVCSDTTNCKPEENSIQVRKFSRLQDIVDSEESD